MSQCLISKTLCHKNTGGIMIDLMREIIKIQKNENRFN